MKHMITSNIWRNRSVIGRPDETCSRCLQIHRDAAGSPNSAAIQNLDARMNQDMTAVRYVCLLTYIAPDGYRVIRIPSPDDHIDGLDNA